MEKQRNRETKHRIWRHWGNEAAASETNMVSHFGGNLKATATMQTLRGTRALSLLQGTNNASPAIPLSFNLCYAWAAHMILTNFAGMNTGII